MQKQSKEFFEIARHASVFGVANILARGVGFLMIPFYTHYLTPAEYGIIEMLDLLIVVISIMFGLGMADAVFRYYHSANNAEDRKVVASTAFLWLAASAAMFALIGLANAESLSVLLLGGQGYEHFVRIILASFWCQTVVECGLIYLRLVKKSVTYSLMEILRLVLGLGLNIYLIAFAGLGVEGLLYGGALSNGVFAVILGGLVLWRVGARFSRTAFVAMLRYGLPLLPMSVALFVMNFANRFFLQEHTDLEQIGLYALGNKFGMLINTLLVSSFWMIWNTKLFEIAQRADAHYLFARAFTYYLLGLLFAALALSSLMLDGMTVIAPASYFDAWKVIPWVALAYVCNGVALYLRGGLLITMNTKQVGWIMSWTAAAALLFYALLIPPFHIQGAAAATLLAYAGAMAWTYYAAQKVYRLAFEVRRIATGTALLVFLFAVSLLVATDNSWLNLFVKAAVFSTFPALLWVAGFFTAGEKEMVRRFSPWPAIAGPR